MRNGALSRSIVCIMAAGIAVSIGLAAVPPSAYGVKEFYVELQKKYVKPNSKKRNDVALSIAFEQAQCTICHPGDDKHKLSQYGGIVAVRINKFDKDNKKKIQETFEEVSKFRPNFQDPKSPTYGDYFKQGRLPPPPAR
jgi:hypothetical protein